MKLKLWVDVAEIIASVAVVITLVILIFQIREGNEIERVEAGLRQAQWDAQMFLMSNELPDILAKIKEVDGNDMQPLMERYNLTYAEAATWNRWLTLMWRGIGIDFYRNGPSEGLARGIRNTATWPDQKLYIQGAFNEEASFYGPEFSAYVREQLPDLF